MGTSSKPSNNFTSESGTTEQNRTSSGTEEKGVLDQAKEAVAHVADSAREQASSQLHTRKDRFAGQVGGVAKALRDTSSQLRNNEEGAIATTILDSVAERIEGVSHYLQTTEPGDVVGEIERFARREPALFLGGAFTVGLLVGRFLKSSSPEQPTARGANGSLRAYSDRNALARTGRDVPYQARPNDVGNYRSGQSSYGQSGYAQRSQPWQSRSPYGTTQPYGSGAETGNRSRTQQGIGSSGTAGASSGGSPYGNGPTGSTSGGSSGSHSSGAGYSGSTSTAGASSGSLSSPTSSLGGTGTSSATKSRDASATSQSSGASSAATSTSASPTRSSETSSPSKSEGSTTQSGSTLGSSNRGGSV